MQALVGTSTLGSAARAVMAQALRVAELGFGSDIGLGGDDPLLDDSLGHPVDMEAAFEAPPLSPPTARLELVEATEADLAGSMAN